MQLDASIDFLDLGCGDGGSLAQCERRFDARGMGLERNPVRVAEAERLGRNVVQADLNDFDPGRGDRVNFITAMDFYEHMPSIDAALTLLRKSATLATDFLFIRHPSFENEGYLSQHGLRLSWTHWHGHKAHLRLHHFCETLNDIGVHRIAFVYRQPILDTSHLSVLPMSAPLDAIEYDSEVHASKTHITFDRPVYGQVDILAALRPYSDSAWSQLLAGSKEPASLAGRFAQRVKYRAHRLLSNFETRQRFK